MVTTDQLFPPGEIQEIINELTPDVLAGFYTPVLTTSLFNERNEFFVRVPSGMTVSPALQEALNRLIATDETTKEANKELTHYALHSLPATMNHLREEVRGELEKKLIAKQETHLEGVGNEQLKQAKVRVKQEVSAAIEHEAKTIQEFLRAHTHGHEHEQHKARLAEIKTAAYKEHTIAEALREETHKIEQHVGKLMVHYREHELPAEVATGIESKKSYFEERQRHLLQNKIAEIAKGLKNGTAYHLTAFTNGNA